jgi:hypothetical protein
LLLRHHRTIGGVGILRASRNLSRPFKSHWVSQVDNSEKALSQTREGQIAAHDATSFDGQTIWHGNCFATV